LADKNGRDDPPSSPFTFFSCSPEGGYEKGLSADRTGDPRANDSMATDAPSNPGKNQRGVLEHLV